MSKATQYHEIGWFRQPGAEKANCPVQPDLRSGGRIGHIDFAPELPVRELMDGYAPGDLIWLLFVFHQAEGWKAKVRPPRWADGKVGVLATRSPHRPNPIGLSCVKLVRCEPQRIEIVGSDLIDGTPILDIKPYLAYTDAHSGAHPNWYHEGPEHTLRFTTRAEEQLRFLAATGEAIRAACDSNLRYPPLLDARKRIKVCGSELYELAFRTWRVRFELKKPDLIHILSLRSGYAPEDFDTADDPHRDKDLHRAFIATYPG